MPDEVAIRTVVPGPWGPFHVAATDRGIVAIGSMTTKEAFDAAIEKRLHGRVRDAADIKTDDPRLAYLAAAVGDLRALLAGHQPEAHLGFDLADRPAWDRAVLTAVAAIPWGRTASYGDIARAIGAPRAARAVGGAVGRNPISLLIPCHRVIAADGSIGGYGSDAWGNRSDRLAMKRDLLLREGVTVGARGG